MKTRFNINKKNIIQALVGALGVVLTLGMVILALHPSTDAFLEEMIANRPELAGLSIALYKALSILIAPLSGTVITVLATKYLGWFTVGAATIIGDLIGYSIAFYIARKSKRFIFKIIDKNTVDQVYKEIENTSAYSGLFLIRLTTKPIGDYVAYIAGITNMSFRTFMLVTIPVELIYEFSVAYFAYLGFNINPIYFFLIGLPILSLYFLYLSWRKRSEIKIEENHEN